MRHATLVIALSASAAAFAPQPGVFLFSAQPATFCAPTNALQGSSGRPFERTPEPALRMEVPSSPSEVVSGRRDLLASVLSAAIVGGLAAPGAAVAKDAINDCEKWAPGRKWISGKSCQEKGSKETKGTKKDPKYLRALQDCKAQGQAPGGKEESNNDINKLCRDEVCLTYEQCTYQIGPKEDYGGFFF